MQTNTAPLPAQCLAEDSCYHTRPIPMSVTHSDIQQTVKLHTTEHSLIQYSLLLLLFAGGFVVIGFVQY